MNVWKYLLNNIVMKKYELIFNPYTYGIFFLLYYLTEVFIQKNMDYPQWIRFHLSDVFCGPVILHMIILSMVKIADADDVILIFVPLVNCILCIIWELTHSTDYIDILCYIIGTILYYTTCIKKKKPILKPTIHYWKYDKGN